MQRETATNVANAWHEAGGDALSGNAYGTLQKALRELVPEPEADVWAAAQVDGLPTALVLSKDGLYVALVRDGEASPVTSLRREPVTQDRSVVRLEQSWEQEGDHVAARLSVWSFERDGSVFLELQARDYGSVLASNGNQKVERFARALAAKLGWTVPDCA